MTYNNAPRRKPECQYCHQLFAFDDRIRSQSGKQIPLDIQTHEPHECQSPNNPYNQRKPQQQQQQQQPEQKQQVNYSGVEVIGGIQEVGDMMKECLTLLRALKPNDVMTKEKEELLRENSELKEAIIKLQEFKPASQLTKADSTDAIDATFPKEVEFTT